MKVKLAVVFVGIALLLLFGFRRLLFHKMMSDDDERPPIIVHNGSLIFETKKHWKKDTSGTHRYNPDHPNGHSVGMYSVVLTGSSTAGCTGTTLTGFDVSIEYRADSNAPAKTFQLTRKLVFTSGGSVKKDPSLESPEDLTIANGTGSAPSQLIYPVGDEGWISNVTIVGTSTTSCAFAKPTAAERPLVNVEIRPIL
jgi:hypothetical protein